MRFEVLLVYQGLFMANPEQLKDDIPALLKWLISKMINDWISGSG
jgi:hypothetical protein